VIVEHASGCTSAAAHIKPRDRHYNAEGIRMSTTTIKRPWWRRAGLVAVVVASVALTAACGSAGGSSNSSGSGGNASYAASAYPTPDASVLKTQAAKVLNPGLDVSSLPPEISQAMMIASKPMTAAQRQTFNKCMASDDCQTGQGKYTLAIVDDQVNTFYSMSRAETVANAVKSGAVKRILHFATDMDVQKYLADWRSAIGQKSDLILSIYGGLGNQAGPVIQQAKAKGIPVVNGCCALAPDISKLLTVNVNASICDMWGKNGGAQKLADYLKAKGDTNPSYAIFTGPAGNAFAGVWQPCVKDALAKVGVKQVYSGNTEWTPQGTVKAAQALMASGSKPDVIIYDTYAEDFIRAFEDAGQKNIPTFVLTASSTVGTAKAYQEAKEKGFDIDVWVAPSIVWLQDLGLQTEIEIADGKKPSSTNITYPMTLTDLANVIKSIDLSVNQAAFIGSTLEPQDQNESLKH
jgi:hypothetical protein